jgi:hypothetical protein
MKFIFVLIAVLALCSCTPDLEAKINTNHLRECVNGVQPIIEKIIDIVYAVQEKRLEQIFNKGKELFNLVKATYSTCIANKNGEINLNIAPLVVVKVVVAVAGAAVNVYKLVQTIRNK